MSTPSIADRYAELCGKVDAFFRRVEAAHTGAMQCRTGCSDCCRVRLTITGLEAAVILGYLDQLTPAERADIAAAARRSGQDRCAALDPAGRCRIYQARPLVCRSHGVPIRQRAANALPVIDVCFRNFTEPGRLDSVAEADILDQRTLSTLLGALDAAFADEHGVARGQRVDLAELLASADTDL